jgi:hypothetical protein
MAISLMSASAVAQTDSASRDAPSAEPHTQSPGLSPHDPPKRDADPSITHDVEVFVPTRVLVHRTANRIDVSEDLTSLQKIQVAVGKNLTLGLKVELRVYPIGEPRPSQPCSGALIGLNDSPAHNLQAATNGGTGVISALGGMPKPGTRYTIEAIFIVFQSASPPIHNWYVSPTGNSYKAFWEKTFRTTR